MKQNTEGNAGFKHFFNFFRNFFVLGIFILKGMLLFFFFNQVQIPK